jgi:hypothetical protein
MKGKFEQDNWGKYIRELFPVNASFLAPVGYCPSFQMLFGFIFQPHGDPQPISIGNYLTTSASSSG